MSNGSEFQAPGSGGSANGSEISGFSAGGVAQRQGTGKIPPGWHRPLPHSLPGPGYWPAIMALGVTFMLWGLAVGFNEVVSTIIILFFIGLILFIISLVGWIGDLRHERKDQNE